jgi:Arc/MetJ-type ribon-helix-helix transcriptional regulator
MNIVLTKVELEKYIEDQVSSGRYGSPEDVVAAALSRQIQEGPIDDFAPGELDELLA